MKNINNEKQLEKLDRRKYNKGTVGNRGNRSNHPLKYPHPQPSGNDFYWNNYLNLAAMAHYGNDYYDDNSYAYENTLVIQDGYITLMPRRYNFFFHNFRFIRNIFY